MSKKFPRYFLVEGEIPVKVDALNGEIFGENSIGNPYPPMKAVVEGVEITQEEFKRAATALSAAE